MKKYTVQVREVIKHTWPVEDEVKVVDTVLLKPWAEQIGNFCPFFVKYKGKRMLLHSEAGDLSDPFRREESYANSFYIELPAYELRVNL